MTDLSSLHLLEQGCNREEVMAYMGLTPNALDRLIAQEAKVRQERRAKQAKRARRDPRTSAAVGKLAIWAKGFQSVTWLMVAEEFKVSRATAYRMLADLRAVQRFNQYNQQGEVK